MAYNKNCLQYFVNVYPILSEKVIFGSLNWFNEVSFSMREKCKNIVYVSLRIAYRVHWRHSKMYRKIVETRGRMKASEE